MKDEARHAHNSNIKHRRLHKMMETEEKQAEEVQGETARSNRELYIQT